MSLKKQRFCARTTAARAQRSLQKAKWLTRLSPSSWGALVHAAQSGMKEIQYKEIHGDEQFAEFATWERDEHFMDALIFRHQRLKIARLDLTRICQRPICLSFLARRTSGRDEFQDQFGSTGTKHVQKLRPHTSSTCGIAVEFEIVRECFSARHSIPRLWCNVMQLRYYSVLQHCLGAAPSCTSTCLRHLNAELTQTQRYQFAYIDYIDVLQIQMS